MKAANLSVGGGSLQFGGLGHQRCRGGRDRQRPPGPGANSYALELTSNGTGTGSSTTVDGPGVRRVQAPAPSSRRRLPRTPWCRWSGTGGYQVTLPGSNSLSGLLPGIAINLVSVSTTPVTIHRVSGRLECGRNRPGSREAQPNQPASRPSPATPPTTHRRRRRAPSTGTPRSTAWHQQVLAAIGSGGRGDVGCRLGRDGGRVGRPGHHQPGNGHLQPSRVRDGLCEEPGRRAGHVHRGWDLHRGAAGVRRSGLRRRRQ